MRLRLFNYWRSSASHRVRIALGLKGLAYEYVAVSLIADGGQHKTDAYRARNPDGAGADARVDRGRRGRARLAQSVAIVEYLDERSSRARRCFPRDPYARAQVRALAEIVNSGIQPLQNLSVTRAIKALGGEDQRRRWNGTSSRRASARSRRGRSDLRRPHSASATPDPLADVCLVPQLYGARRFNGDLAAGPGRCCAVERGLVRAPAVRGRRAQRPSPTPTSP